MSPGPTAMMEEVHKIPPGHKKVVLFREDFEDWEGAVAVEIVPDSRAGSKCCAAGKPSASGYSRVTVPTKGLRVSADTCVSLSVLLARAGDAVHVNLWSQSRRNNLQYIFSPSRGGEWTRVVFEVRQTRLDGVPASGFPVEVASLTVAAKTPAGGLFIDDIEMYDIVPVKTVAASGAVTPPVRASGTIIARYDFDDGAAQGWNGRGVQEQDRECLLAAELPLDKWFSSVAWRRAGLVLGKDTRMTVRYLLDRGEVIKLQCDDETAGGIVSKELSAATGAWTTVSFNMSKLKRAEPGHRLTEYKVFSGQPGVKTRLLIDEIVIHEGELAPARPVEIAEASDEGWQTIFNGRDLTGWIRAGGGRAYVENGALVCENGADLLYAADWAEFVLDCEIKGGGGSGDLILGLGLSHSGLGRGEGRARIWFHKNGDLQVVRAGKRPWRSGVGKFPLDRWTPVKLEITQSTLKVYKGETLLGAADISQAPVQKGGIYFYSFDGHTARMRNARVRVISR